MSVWPGVQILILVSKYQQMEMVLTHVMENVLTTIRFIFAM